MKLLFLNLLALGALISSVLVITAKNPVIAILFLISVFVRSAGFLMLYGIGFVGLAYIIVYVGAIIVLFLFVIMLLNIRISEIIETNRAYTKNLPLAFIIGSVFIYDVYTIIPFSLNDLDFLSLFIHFIQTINNTFFNDIDLTDNIVFHTINPIVADINFLPILSFASQLRTLGLSLYTYAAIWLIITSLILLLSMIAPLFLTGSANNKK